MTDRLSTMPQRPRCLVFVAAALILATFLAAGCRTGPDGAVPDSSTATPTATSDQNPDPGPDDVVPTLEPGPNVVLPTPAPSELQPPNQLPELNKLEPVVPELNELDSMSVCSSVSLEDLAGDGLGC